MTRVVVDPGPVRPWLNPGEPGWRNVTVRPHEKDRQLALIHPGRRRGYVWTCPNHPEYRGGAIHGSPRSWADRSREEALAALAEHMRRYHGAT